MLYATTIPSPLGELTLVSTDAALTALWLDRRAFLADTAGRAVEERPDALPLKLGRDWIAAYFAGGRPAVGELPLAPDGTPFQQLIWQLLRTIPYGECVTYGDIAREAARALGKEHMSSRAVGGAVGANPLAIIIPCHRVVGADGNLTGYGGGIARKIRLLALEGVDVRRYSLPRRGKYAAK